MNFSTGPFIKVACFCDAVIEGKDGVFSLIRIVNILNNTVQGASVSDEMPPIQHILKLVIMIVPGMARGRHNLTIVPESPSGLRDADKVVSVSIHFEEGRDANLIADFNYIFESEGTYLFHISLDDNHLTSIPMTVRYNRFVTGN